MTPANTGISNDFRILMHSLGIKIEIYMFRVKLYNSLASMGKATF